MLSHSSKELLHYNALDTMNTELIQQAIWPELLSSGNLPAYERTIKIFPALMAMMQRGIQVNHQKLDETRNAVAKLITEKQNDLNDLCGRPINPKSAKDCQSYFYIERGIKPYTKSRKKSDGTRSSTITTDDKAMQRIARGTSTRAGLVEARLVQELRGLHKLKGTYLEIEFDSDGRLRCDFKPRGTRFSRLSSAKTIFGTGMNLQNLPPAFKRFLVADPGYFLWSIDKEQAEWVVVAYDAMDASMINVCEKGLDPHSYTASQMYDVSEGIIVSENDLVGHESDPIKVAELRTRLAKDLTVMSKKPPRNMSMRQAGKKANHGLNYDEGYVTFALTNEILESEAKDIISFYHSIYPGIRQMYHRIQDQLSCNRTLENCFDRKYKFLGRLNYDLYKVAYSYNPQSSVGDLINEGLIKMYDHPDERSELLSQTHDSVEGQYHYDSRQHSCCAKTMWDYLNALNPELNLHGRSFYIKNSLKVGMSFDESDMISVPIPATLRDFKEILREKLEELPL